MISMNNYRQRIEDLAEELADIKITLNNLQERPHTSKDAPQPVPYNQAHLQNLNKKVHETNQILKDQIRRKDAESPEDAAEKKNRTRIVLQPKDVSIKNSRDLRKEFSKYFADAIVKNARISAGGSYVFEFEDEETAINVTENWKNEYFKGNARITKITDKNCTGIVKYVYADISEDTIDREIKRNYEGATYELFKKNNEFTGSIKVNFKDEATLKTVVQNKFSLDGRKYQTEVFKHKPKVIKCNTCQRFGHISRLCRAKDKPVCGKCSTEGHESRDCTAAAEEYKCFHCGSSEHITGSYNCEIVKEKLLEINNRHNYG